MNLDKAPMCNSRVIGSWVDFCNVHKEYFESFPDSLKNANLNAKIKFGNKCNDADKIGEWCQFFLESLPDDNSIHKTPFSELSDIASWWCFGDD